MTVTRRQALRLARRYRGGPFLRPVPPYAINIGARGDGANPRIRGRWCGKFTRAEAARERVARHEPRLEVLPPGWRLLEDGDRAIVDRQVAARDEVLEQAADHVA